MVRAFAVMGRVLRAALAVVALAGLMGGVPWLLLAVVGWPLSWLGWPRPNQPPDATELLHVVTSPWSDTQVLAVLGTLGWLLWLLLVRDVVVEVIEAAADVSDARHGRTRLPAGRRGPIRWVAAVLVGAIAGAIFLDTVRGATGLGRTQTASAAADVAAHRPATAVAAAPVRALPAGFTLTTGPQPARPVTTSASSTTIPVSTSNTDHGVPVWAADAPGGVHRVVKGDNLWDIAAHELDDPHRWREIYTLNRGHVQRNGYALTDPDEIHVGWVLALPARASAPARGTPQMPAGPAATDPAPSVPTNPAPGDKRSGSAVGPSASTATPNPSSTPDPANPSATAPSSTAGQNTPHRSASATASPESAPAAPEPDHAHDGAGINLPFGGWVSLGLAASIAAVAALVRRHRRRRARLPFPIPVRTGPVPAPLPASLAPVDVVGSRRIFLDSDRLRPVASSSPAPIAVDGDGVEVSLFDLPGSGIALSGDGADGAARAILAATLTTGAVDTAIETRPVVATTTGLMARLLPPETTPAGLDPDRTSFDGERLIILADTAEAVTHAEEEMIVRRRLLDTFEVDTITALNARTDHAETQPPYVLLIEPTNRQAGRLQTVASYRGTLDLHPVVVGPSDGISTLQVAADGAVTGTDETRQGRMAILSAEDLAAVLAMLTEVIARPEAGHDVDDPPARAPDAAPVGEPVETVPTQQRQSPALAQVRVLGPVTVSTDTGPIATGMRSGSYAVLALLAAHPAGRTLAQLADAMYATVEEAVAVKRIRTYINTVRRVLREATGQPKPMFILHNTTTGLYRLDPDMITVDVWQMLTAIERANTATDDNEALAALRDAADLYGGDFANGRDQPWAVDYATTYRRQILSVHARIAELLEADQPDQAIAALEHAIDLDPVNEELYQRIMRIHGRAHRPDAVNRTLRRLEERLTELDDEPSAATRRVAERQLRSEPVPGGRQ